MGVQERTRKEQEEIKERIAQKETLINQVKVMKDIEGLMSLPEYKSYEWIYKEVENYSLYRLCEVKYKNKQGEEIYVPPVETQLRQRIFNSIKDWICMPQVHRETGKKAELLLEEIAEKEKNEVSELENRERS